MAQTGKSIEPRDLQIRRLHKVWADRFTLFWQILIFALYGGIYVLLEQSGMDAASRAGAFVFLSAIVLVAAIWQAVGLGVARVHMLLEGLDLEAKAGNDSMSGRGTVG